MTGPRALLANGMFDHGREKLCGCIFPVQRPRHFRALLSIMTWLLLITLPAILFTSMSSLIYLATPMWERVSVPGFPNDTAIFMFPNEGGVLSMRICNGSVPYICQGCNYYSQQENTTSAGSKNDNNNNPAPSTATTMIEQQEDERSAFALETTATPSNNNVRTSHPNDLCDCGALLEWENCELQTPPFAISDLCPQVQAEARNLFKLLLAWSILGMVYPAVFGWSLLFIPLNCMLQNRYKRPSFVAVVLLFHGVIFPAGCLALTILMVQAKDATANPNLMCAGGSGVISNANNNLKSNGFRETGIHGIWETAVAGIFFSALSIAIYLPIQIRVWLFGPIPERDGRSKWMFIPPSQPQAAPDEGCDCCFEEGCYCCECCDTSDINDLGFVGNCCDCYNDYENEAGALATAAEREEAARNAPNNENNIDPTTEMTTITHEGLVVSSNTVSANFDLPSPPMGQVVNGVTIEEGPLPGYRGGADTNPFATANNNPL